MADYRSVAAVSESVLQVLRTSYVPEDFNQELEFRAFTARDFANPMSAGVSLFLYRVLASGIHRTPPGPLQVDGSAGDTLLQLRLRRRVVATGGKVIGVFEEQAGRQQPELE